jgi:ABC-type molybdate transport system ATPase subunit
MDGLQQTGKAYAFRSQQRFSHLSARRELSYGEKTSRRMVIEQLAMALLIVGLWFTIG